jgi:hypothetical protein
LLDMTGSRVILVVGGLGGLVATGWMALHLLRPGSQATTDEESVIA